MNTEELISLLASEKQRADAAEERANAAEERANAAVQTACNLLISLDRYVTSSPSVALALTCRGEHKLTWLPPFGY